MSNTTNKPATDEDVRRAFTDFLNALSPEGRQRLNRDPAFNKQLADHRRAAILAHVESPEVMERRRQMSDIIANSGPTPNR